MELKVIELCQDLEDTKQNFKSFQDFHNQTTEQANNIFEKINLLNSSVTQADVKELNSRISRQRNEIRRYVQVKNNLNSRLHEMRDHAEQFFAVLLRTREALGSNGADSIFDDFVVANQLKEEVAQTRKKL